MPETPEQKARREIDADLSAAGWLVQSRDDLDLSAGRGTAVREFPLKSGFGFADYLLYVDRKPIGAVEAKAHPFAGMEFPLPPLGEQEQIVEAVEDQLSVIDHIETDLETKLQTAQALRQSILRHAFTDRLVPQDPNDEPASELLKRIAAEREERARQASAAKGNGPKAKARRRTRRAPRYGAQKTGSYSG